MILRNYRQHYRIENFRKIIEKLSLSKKFHLSPTPTQYRPPITNHCCPILTPYTASLPHNAQLSQLDLVYCSYPSSREERYEAETLRHHQAALLYNVLEPDWLQNSGTAADDGTKTLDEEHSNQNMNRSKIK